MRGQKYIGTTSKNEIKGNKNLQILSYLTQKIRVRFLLLKHPESMLSCCLNPSSPLLQCSGRLEERKTSWFSPNKKQGK